MKILFSFMGRGERERFQLAKLAKIQENIFVWKKKIGSEMQVLSIFRSQSGEIEGKIEYRFADKALLEEAFVHKSFLNENVELVKGSNERLEFLGDSILGLIVSEFLYLKLPTVPEGTLSELRARLVEAKALQTYVEKLGIANYLIVGKGESKEERKGSFVADLFEALIGAIYLDGGFVAAREFLFTHFQKEIEATLGAPPRNWKTELQEIVQKKFNTKPLYRVVHEEGPDHAKVFHVMVSVGEEEMGFGVGNSKKQAEVSAAEKALAKVMENE